MVAAVETPFIYLDMTARDNLKQQYLILGLPAYDGISKLLSLVGLTDTGKFAATLRMLAVWLIGALVAV